MLTRFRRSSAAFLLAALSLAQAANAAAIIRVTEVMSSSGVGGTADWFELTNYGDAAIDISGWRMDDNSYSFAASLALVPFASGTEAAWTTIGPGESAVFLESAVPATDVPNFQSFWNIGPNPGTVRNPKLATYVGSGASFSSGGDGVIVFRSDSTEVTRTAFGAATGGSTFFWSYDSAGVPATAALGTVSVPGLADAYSTASTPSNVGSPGIAVVAAPVVNLFWTGNGSTLGGSGTWNTTAARWSPTESPVAATTWTDGRGAVFTGSAGTIAVASPVAATVLDFRTSGHTLTSAGGSVATSTIQVVTGGTATIAARLTGASALGIAGGGTVVLSNTANDYTGPTSVAEGSLRAAASNVVPDASRLSVARFMTANLDGFAEKVNGISGLGTVRIGSALTIGISGSTDAVFDGFLSGTGNLVVDSSGAGAQRLDASTQTLADGAVKDYTGRTVVQRGTLAVHFNGVPTATSAVDVESAGTLRLASNARTYAFAGGAATVNLRGGTLTQGQGDDVELVNPLAVSGAARIAVTNDTTPDPLNPSTEDIVLLGALSGTAGSTLTLVASSTVPGADTGRVVFGSATGNTFAGTIAPQVNAVARFTGAYAQAAVALAGGTLDGSGVVGGVTGAGTISPVGDLGAAGILTAASVTAAPTTAFEFSFATANAEPVWFSPTSSENDVLRLTAPSPLPVSLASTNVIRLFLGVPTLSASDAFTGGFFTTADSTTRIDDATIETFVLGNGLGTDSYVDGQGYYSLASYAAQQGQQLAASVTMVSTTSAFFDISTPTSGYVMRTTYAAPPATIIINVPSGTQTQTQAGYPTLSGSTPVLKTGAGTLVLDQANTLSGSTTVQGGVLQLANGSALSASRLVVVAGGTGQVAPVTTTSVASLDLASGNGLLDLTRGALTISSGMTPTALVAEILEGRGDGSWTGTSGITSSTAAAESAAGTPRAVGWIDNGDGSLTTAYAAPGDTNIDWSIDILDAANFLSGGKFDTGSPAIWFEGDFSYDGVVDILDAADFFATGLYDAGNYNTAPGVSGGIAAVPEPSGLAGIALAAAAAGLSLRRRRPARRAVVRLTP
jgi:autotransporter-associated beta strand protein